MRASPGRFRPFLLAAGLILEAFTGLRSAAGAPPTIGSIHPAGGQRGTEVEILTTGKPGDLPVTVSCESPGIQIVQNPDPKKSQSFRVTIGKGVSAGPHLFWFRNAHGVAAPRHFIVGRHREIQEKEPNNSPAQSQAISELPVTINGRLEKSEDVDSFRIEVTEPCWLIAEATAYGIDSPIDPLLHLRGPGGQRVAFAHDGGHRLDPLLAWNVEEPGTYTLEVAGFVYPPSASVRFSGGATSIYRLTISTGPWIHSARPLAIGSEPTEFKIRGWNGEETTITIDPPGADGESLPCIESEVFHNAFRVMTSDLRENVEKDTGNKLTLPSAVTGSLEKAGEADRFAFMGTKGRQLRFEVHSASLGFPVDPVLRIESADGKELARADDSDRKKRSGQDPALEWTPKEDGEFHAIVSDLLGRGGERCLYRLVARETAPGFIASTGSFSLVLEPGKSAELKVTTKRLHGFKGALRVALEEPPAGVTAEGGEVPEKGGEVVLTVKASADAKPWQGRVALAILESGTPGGKRKDVAITLKGASTDAGDLLINETRGLWLTVKSPAAGVSKK